MRRLLLSFGFACFLAAASHGGAIVDELCEQGCADDDANGKCADTCVDCACCSHSTQTAPLLSVAATGAASFKQVDVEWSDRVLPFVDPREILHVPKNLA